MQTNTLADTEWQSLLARLPKGLDLERTAYETGALRRKRKVKSASDLLRLILAYCTCKMSFRLTATWAGCIQLAALSDVALLKRVRNAHTWLEFLLTAMLNERTSCAPILLKESWRIQLVDATCVKTVGPSGHTWRIHTRFDLDEGRMEGLVLGNVRSSERFAHFRWQAGDIAVGDRAYSRAKELQAVLDQGADFIVRTSTKMLPLRNPNGSWFDTVAAARSTPKGEANTFVVHLFDTWQKGRFLAQGRLIIFKLSE